MHCRAGWRRRRKMGAMAKDWFRRPTWDESDQVDFFAHLSRSRGVAYKAQYLRIQASHFETSGSLDLIRVALILLEKILIEFPAENELAVTYYQKASCLAKLGRIGEAAICYRLAIETESKLPRWGTRAYISFGRLVAENGLTDLFDEALEMLDEFKRKGIEFPRDVYEKAGIRAIIAAQRKETERAKGFAAIALDAASKTHSGFRYHPGIGLVKDKETQFYVSVEAIAQT
jgi:tetratricopeptide (TPR) repeat protein